MGTRLILNRKCRFVTVDNQGSRDEYEGTDQNAKKSNADGIHSCPSLV